MHLAAHRFGAALYNAVGLSGLSVCDNRFAYGCFHEITGKAVAKEGISVLTELRSYCKNSEQCLHGVGHGIQASFGYDMPALVHAFKTCSTLDDEQPLYGCESGAMMEYDLQNMALKGRERTVTSAAPMEPCDSLSASRGVCFFWQPYVWKKSWLSGTSSLALANRMGALCRTLSEENRYYCMGGIGGAVISLSNYSTSSIRQLCDAAAIDSRDRVICLGSAAQAISGSINDTEGITVCSGLPELEEKACEKYAQSSITPPELAQYLREASKVSP